jgi:curli production assembly/transport component CsgG
MKLLAMLLCLTVTGCTQFGVDTYPVLPPTTQESPLNGGLQAVPELDGEIMTIAVYSFLDKTGQTKPSDTASSLSSAVTQGGEVWVIKALQDVGNSTWFEVVERGGLANLTQERQIIRQMREAYDGPTAKKLMPMKFAGMLIEGGITGYDTSTRSGGIGMRVLGIGPQSKFSEDIITISLRAVSVNTGTVIAAVNVQKTVYSTADSMAILKFFDSDTQIFEFESGITLNEPATLAVKTTVEAAVVELIKEGERKDVWEFAEGATPYPVLIADDDLYSPPLTDDKETSSEGNSNNNSPFGVGR